MNKSNLIIVGLVLIILGLIYFNRISSNKIAQESVAYKALLDTTHFYRNQVGGQAGYISVIQASNKSLQQMLQSQVSKNSSSQSIIDSLKKDKNIQSATVVTTGTKIKYIHDLDTVYRNVVFNDSVSTKWYDLGVHIRNSKLGVNLDQRDEINLTSTKKDNKGLFTGSTLTTYASSANPDVKITGITSVSTVVDKRKPRLGSFIGPSLVVDKNAKVNLGIAVGVGLTF